MSVGANSNEEGTTRQLGCYMTAAAPFPGVICEDTWLGTLKEKFGDFSLFFVIITIFAFPHPVVIALWCPMLYSIWYVIKGRHISVTKQDRST